MSSQAAQRLMALNDVIHNLALHMYLEIDDFLT